MASREEINNAVTSAILMSFATLSDSSAACEFFFFNKTRRSHRNTVVAAAVALSRIKDFRTEVVPRFSDPTFKRHFRVSRSTFAHVLQLLPAESPSGVPRQTEALLGLWVLGHAESFASVADRFRLPTRSAARAAFLHFCGALATRSPDFVQWPRGLQAVRVQRDFDRLRVRVDGADGITYVPDVVGCINTVCLELTSAGQRAGPPGVNHYDSIRRRRLRRRLATTTVAVQAVCDARLLFTDVFAGCSTATHDGRPWEVAEFFESSPLSWELRTNPDALPASAHLLGDASFPLSTTLLTPHQTAVNEWRRLYNQTLLATRGVTIIRAFAQLLGRFRACLSGGGLAAVSRDSVPRVVLACCVLHNLCVTLGDRAPELDRAVPTAASRRTPSVNARGSHKRDEIVRRMAVITQRTKNRNSAAIDSRL